MPGSYPITSFCSENVGPKNSQPPAEDRPCLPCPLSGTGPGTQTAPVMPRCCRDSRVWARRLPSTLSPMSTALDHPAPMRPQMAMDSLGLVLGRISCKEFWLCVCLFVSQNETFYRFYLCAWNSNRGSKGLPDANSLNCKSFIYRLSF